MITLSRPLGHHPEGRKVTSSKNNKPKAGIPVACLHLCFLFAVYNMVWITKWMTQN